MAPRKQKETPKQDEKRPLVEWAFGLASAAVIAALIAFLAYGALFGNGHPPDLRAAIEGTEPVGNGTLVRISLINMGEETAADVTVRADWPNLDGAASKTLRFDYVPAGSTRHGAFIIEGGDVTEAEMRLSVDGFSEL